MKKITRRKFVKSSLALGSSAILTTQLPGILKAVPNPQKSVLYSCSADQPMEALPRLFEALGGLERYISGKRVGILVNSPWVHPGYYTHPDIALALLKLCKDAGATSLVCFKPVRDGYWEESRYFEANKSLLGEVTYGSDRAEVNIPAGVWLKKAEIFKIFLETDVYLSVPVAKHHSGTLFSGNLKGLMGVSSSATNRLMHSPEGQYTYEKHEYLAQCIADLNLIRQPDLCIVDASECGLNNGPRGPGDTVRPDLIFAGTDPVALDTYTAHLIGFDVNDIATLANAAAHGMGVADLESIEVRAL